MARVLLSARVTQAQAAVLRAYADEAGLPLYQATVRALERGIAALVSEHEAVPDTTSVTFDISSIEEGMGVLQAHIERVGKIGEQALYAAGAAYAAGVASAKEQMPSDLHAGFDSALKREADQIFKRQLAKAQEP